MTERGEGQHKKNLIGRTFCFFSVIADPKNNGGHDGHMKNMYPDKLGASSPSGEALVSVIGYDEESCSKKKRINPLGSGSTIEADIQK
jgi:hypothetical protein